MRVWALKITSKNKQNSVSLKEEGIYILNLFPAVNMSIGVSSGIYAWNRSRPVEHSEALFSHSQTKAGIWLASSSLCSAALGLQHAFWWPALSLIIFLHLNEICILKHVMIILHHEEIRIMPCFYTYYVGVVNRPPTEVCIVLLDIYVL